MEKPSVVCHMMTSLDGKIDGPYMGDPACAPALEKYGEIRGFYGCSATLYGTTTMLGSSSAGRAPAKLPDNPSYPMATCRPTTWSAASMAAPGLKSTAARTRISPTPSPRTGGLWPTGCGRRTVWGLWRLCRVPGPEGGQQHRPGDYS